MTTISSPSVRERWNNQALWRLLWPLVVEQLLAVTIGMADTIMVTSAGESAVSGIAIVDAINILLITAFSALATGGAVVISQFLGRKDNNNASLAAKQLVYSIVSVSLVITLPALIFSKPILSLIYGHIAPDVMANAEIYFLLSAASYPFLALYNAGAAIFRSMGNSKVSMRISILVNLINISGNAILIFGFGWGVAGAGFSSLLSRIVAAIVVIILLTRRGLGMPVSLVGITRGKISFPLIRSILKIGVPNGLESSMFQIGKLITARLVSTLGTSAIAGNSIALIFSTFSFLPGSAVSLSLITVIGQCIGAKDAGAAKFFTRKLMKIAWVSTGIINLLVPLFAKLTLPLFNLSAEANALALQCIFVFSIAAILFWAPSFALPNALRAAGDVRYTMLVSMFTMWIFRVGLSYLFVLVFHTGAIGIWYAMSVDWLVRAILFSRRWKSEKWKDKKIIA